MGYKKSREHLANFTSATFNSKNVGISHQGRATSNSNDMGAPDLPGGRIPGIGIGEERNIAEPIDTTGTAANVVTGGATTAPSRSKGKRKSGVPSKTITKKLEPPKKVGGGVVAAPISSGSVVRRP